MTPEVLGAAIGADILVVVVCGISAVVGGAVSAWSLWYTRRRR